VGAAAPLQQAGAIALKSPQAYYDKLATDYTVRRERLLKILTASGFKVFKPLGAYYIMTDISAFGFPDDVAFAKFLVEKVGVAVVPGSSFYNDARDGASQVRFTFCKKESTLAAAEERLSKLRA
jgi:aminotransferase